MTIAFSLEEVRLRVGQVLAAYRAGDLNVEFDLQDESAPGAAAKAYKRGPYSYTVSVPTTCKAATAGSQRPWNAASWRAKRSNGRVRWTAGGCRGPTRAMALWRI